MRRITSNTCTASDTGLEEDRDECTGSAGTTGGMRTMKIVPRVALEIDPSKIQHDDLVTKLLLPLSKAYDFEGFTLEIPIQHYAFIGQIAR